MYYFATPFSVTHFVGQTFMWHLPCTWLCGENKDELETFLGFKDFSLEQITITDDNRYNCLMKERNTEERDLLDLSTRDLQRAIS